MMPQGYSLFSGKTIPQVAIRWLIQKEIVSSVIIGATSISQLDDNMGASSGWELSLEEVSQGCGNSEIFYLSRGK